MRLDRRRVLITGGGSGIRLEIRQLADASEVVIAGRSTSGIEEDKASNPNLRVAQLYAASKAGLHSRACSLRAEQAGISVRGFEALLPVVDPDITRVARSPSRRRRRRPP